MNRVSRASLGLLLATVGLVACGPGAASTDTAREHVVDAFQAIRSRDCAALRRLMPRVQDDEACEHFLEDAQGHQLELLEVVSAANDGRDPQAVIVRCRVRMEGEEREMLVRAEERESGWAVSM